MRSFPLRARGEINLVGFASRLESSGELGPAPARCPRQWGGHRAQLGLFLPPASIPWHQPIRKEGFVSPDTLGNETGCAQEQPQGTISTAGCFLHPAGLRGSFCWRFPPLAQRESAWQGESMQQEGRATRCCRCGCSGGRWAAGVMGPPPQIWGWLPIE